MIDLQKARAEKRALEAERAAQAKVATLVQAGWLPVHAQAMVEVGRLNGGRKLTLAEVRQKNHNLVSDYNAVRNQIGKIEHEGHKLTTAASALEAHQKA